MKTKKNLLTDIFGKEQYSKKSKHLKIDPNYLKKSKKRK